MREDTTEEKILAAAKRVFMKKGMHGARMQEIADEAGINKALLHYYFRSKDKLFDAIFQKVFQELVSKTSEVFKGILSLEEKIRLFVANYIDTISLNPFLPLFIINEISQNPDRLNNISGFMGGILEELSKEIATKAKAGEYRETDSLQLLSNIISMTVFPFLAKPIIQGVFHYSDEKFHEFIKERKQLIPDIIMSQLKIQDEP